MTDTPTPDENHTRELLAGFTNPPSVTAAPDGRITITVTKEFWQHASRYALDNGMHQR